MEAALRVLAFGLMGYSVKDIFLAADFPLKSTLRTSNCFLHLGPLLIRVRAQFINFCSLIVLPPCPILSNNASVTGLLNVP
jgi:hypothetical protein